MISTYDELLNYSVNNSNKLIILKFEAKWCGPCKAIKPFITYLQNEYPNIEFYEFDIEDDNKTTITEKFEIVKVPTFIYYKNGTIHDTVIGTNKEKIEDKINDYL